MHYTHGITSAGTQYAPPLALRRSRTISSSLHPTTSSLNPTTKLTSPTTPALPQNHTTTTINNNTTTPDYEALCPTCNLYIAVGRAGRCRTGFYRHAYRCAGKVGRTTRTTRTMTTTGTMTRMRTGKGISPEVRSRGGSGGEGREKGRGRTKRCSVSPAFA